MQEFLKLHPNTTPAELSNEFGCSLSWAGKVKHNRFYRKSKKKEKKPQKPGTFPNRHSGRRDPLDNVLKIDAHRSAARMEGEFLALKALITAGLDDIEETIADIDKMPENRTRIRALMKSADSIVKLMDPEEVKKEPVAVHKSVVTKINLRKTVQ